MSNQSEKNNSNFNKKEKLNLKKKKKKLTMKTDSKESKNHIFTKQEVELNNKAAKFVKITPQTRAKLERIPNKIGPYECKLCRVVYASAFELAMHNCPQIFHLEYKCSECDKVFNSPANLASHKRWHRPKPSESSSRIKEYLGSSISISSSDIPMTSRQSQIQDHLISQHHHHHQQQNEWFAQFYSNYLAVATQNFFTTLPCFYPNSSLFNEETNLKKKDI